MNAMGDSNLQEKGKPLDSLNSTGFMEMPELQMSFLNRFSNGLLPSFQLRSGLVEMRPVGFDAGFQAITGDSRRFAFDSSQMFVQPQVGLA